jgi:hypothetical protein
LRKEPVKVEISLKDGETAKVTLVPDAFCKLVLPSGHATWIFLEIDRGTVTVESSHWELRSWRRKILAYRQLQESGALQGHFGAESMIVATVTTSEQRLQNLKKASERANADHRFWFSIIERVNSENILTQPIWTIAGLGRNGQRLLPAHDRDEDPNHAASYHVVTAPVEGELHQMAALLSCLWRLCHLGQRSGVAQNLRL